MRKPARGSGALAASLAIHALILLLPLSQALGRAPRAEGSSIDLVALDLPGILPPLQDAKMPEEAPDTPAEPPPQTEAPPLEAVETQREDFVAEEGETVDAEEPAAAEAPGISSIPEEGPPSAAAGLAGATGPLFLDAEAVDQKPRFSFQAAITYPPEARRANLEGLVVLLVDLNERGKVVGLRVESSSDPIFERAAFAMIKASRFSPARSSGRPVAVRMRLPVRFRLK